MTQTLTPTAPLTAADRCDRCNAQAYVRAVMPNGSELLFCGHHGREYDDALRDVVADLQDETDRLHETPNTAPEEER